MTQLALDLAGEFSRTARFLAEQPWPRIPEYVAVSPMEQFILEYLGRVGPRTADEISRDTGIDINSIAPRLRDLRASGKVERTGERRRTRAAEKTGKNITAAVYRIREPRP